MKVYCCGCKTKVEARETTGAEIYPTFFYLSKKIFLKCDTCGNYVGVHNKRTDEGRLRPLGSIPTPELRKARQEIHAVLDPVWQSQKMSRTEVYAKMSFKLGIREFHTGEIDSMVKANFVLKCAKEIQEGK